MVPARQGSMRSSDQKEEFSYAYVHAVAACAGCAVDRPKKEGQDKLDVLVRSERSLGPIHQPRIELQLKCSERITVKRGRFAFEIDADLYQELRKLERNLPLFLVIMHVPSSIPDWMEYRKNHAHIRHCAYLVNLRGAPATTNTRSVTIHVRAKDLFNAESLTNLMVRAAHGEFVPKVPV